ncbi:MAG: hypothetical protein ACE5G7_07250, partial [Candidatus Hydrothermarchaeaceae archaeon]
MRVVILVMLLMALPFVSAQVEEDASEALSRAREDAAEMSDLGLGTTYVDDALRDATKAMEDGGYLRVIERANDISARKERAFSISDSLRALDLRIKDVEEKGLDSSSAREMRDAALDAFGKENYDEAEEFIFLSNNNLDGVEAEYSLVQARYNAARDNLGSYVRRHRLGIVLALVLVVVIGLIIYYLAAVSITQHRLKDLELEKEVLSDLMEKTQVDYFKKNAMSRDTYDIRMRTYRERRVEVDESIPMLRARLEGLRGLGFEPRIPFG